MDSAPFYDDLADGPKGGEAFWLQTQDELRLRVGIWPSDGTILGTVFVLPGRTEYIEIHGWTARDLSQLGYTSVVLDWRGHGLSDGRPSDGMGVHAIQFGDYQQDIDALIQFASDRQLPKPWFILGNSMGGCIGLRALANGLPMAACAFTSPMWGIQMSGIVRPVAWLLSWGASKTGNEENYVLGHDRKNYAGSQLFEDNRITNSPEGFNYWKDQSLTNPSLQTAGSTMGWLLAALTECRALARVPAPDIPCISFFGDQDSVVDTTAIEVRMKNWPDGRVIKLSDTKHGLLLEKQETRAKIMDNIGALFRNVAKKQ